MNSFDATKSSSTIKRPANISSNTLNVSQALADIEKYQRACGAGKELDATRKAPVVPTEPNANDIFPRPATVLPPAAGLTGTALDDAKAAFKEYKEDVKLHHESQRLFDAKVAAYHQAKERLSTYNCEHEKWIGNFATFFPVYKFDELEKNDVYKVEKTLYNAYIGMTEIMSCSKITGNTRLFLTKHITCVIQIKTNLDPQHRHPNSPRYHPGSRHHDP